MFVIYAYWKFLNVDFFAPDIYICILYFNILFLFSLYTYVDRYRDRSICIQYICKTRNTEDQFLLHVTMSVFMKL